MIVEESVAVCKSGCNVGKRFALLHVETLHREIGLVGRIAVAVEFVGTVLHYVAMGKGLEVVVEEMAIVSCLYIHCEQALLRSILHHHVHSATYTVAFHVGSE